MNSACLGSNMTRASNPLGLCPTDYNSFLIILATGLILILVTIYALWFRSLFIKDDDINSIKDVKKK